MELKWRNGKDVSDIPFFPGMSPYAHYWLTQILSDDKGQSSDAAREAAIVALSTGLNASVDDLVERAFGS